MAEAKHDWTAIPWRSGKRNSYENRTLKLNKNDEIKVSWYGRTLKTWSRIQKTKLWWISSNIALVHKSNHRLVSSPSKIQASTHSNRRGKKNKYSFEITKITCYSALLQKTRRTIEIVPTIQSCI